SSRRGSTFCSNSGGIVDIETPSCSPSHRAGAPADIRDTLVRARGARVRGRAGAREAGAGRPGNAAATRARRRVAAAEPARATEPWCVRGHPGPARTSPGAGPGPAQPGPSVPVALEEHLLSVVGELLVAANEDVLRLRGELEGVAVPDHDVGVLADLERAVPVRDAEDLRRHLRHGCQGRFVGHAVA